MKTAYRLGLALAASVAMSTFAMAQDKPQLAFVVNGASDFWKIAEAGVKKAQAELPDYELQLQISGAGRGRHPAAPDGRPRRRRHRRHHDQRRRSEDLDRRA